MRRFGPLLLAAALLGAAVPVLAVSESAPDDLDHNRRLLEKYRTDPEHYARLLRDLRAFQALPAERQERIRQFDRDLHDEDYATQGRLWDVLERYTDWASRLPEADQKRIEDAPDRAARLAVVRELREKDWIDRLPKADRDAVLALAGPQRAATLTEHRQKERQRRQEWLDWADGQKTRPEAAPGGRPKRPSRLGEFPPDVQDFVNKQLTPMLSEEEKEQMKKAGALRWPALATSILDLADKHPVLPPLPGGPVVNYDQLPPGTRHALEELRGQGKGDNLDKDKGKWPQFALAAADLLKRANREGSPLGASLPSEFPADVQTFIRKLPEPDRGRIHDLEGRWPEYPLALLDIAHKDDLSLPGMSLPGPRELWTSARSALPDVPPRTLLRFWNELTPAEQAGIKPHDLDQAEWHEVLKQEYFKKHPDALKGYLRQQRRDR